jgi:tetratricopeptide (TPR) repeat protein
VTLQVRSPGKLILTFALAAGCLHGSQAAGAQQEGKPGAASSFHSQHKKTCPPPSDLDQALGAASTFMTQSRFQDAAATLQSVSGIDCDPRVGLLLAAAMEGEGNLPQATAALQRAHSVWPANDSIAVSLARLYLKNGETPKAEKTLASFHAAPGTPEQEMEMAVVVHLAAHALLAAQSDAELAYKTYPSVHTLLLLANTLQLQGRYPDVNRLLGAQRTVYSGSPEFLVTIAESEFDASLYPAARDDLQHAISLQPGLYQAHYLLGNVLFKLGDAHGAIAQYRQAIDLAPGQARSYYQLSLVLQSLQDEAGEKRALEGALAADSHYAPAHCELGRLLLESRRPADAVSHLAAAIQFNPHSEKGYFLLARAYAELGEKEKSNAMIKRLLAVKKENHLTAKNNTEDRPPADN